MSAESSWQRPYRGYLFDLDGTLVDTAPDIGVALNTALERKGYQPVSDDHTRHWVGHGARVLLEQALDHQQQSFAAVDEMLEVFITHYAEHIADCSTPYPEVVASLAALRARGAKLPSAMNPNCRRVRSSGRKSSSIIFATSRSLQSRSNLAR